MYKKKRFIATVFVLLGIGILCTLGTWQVQRLQWKSDIIARLDAARAAPQDFSFTSLEALAAEDMPLAYGSVKGVLMTARDVLVGPAPGADGAIGYFLVTPLHMKDGTILVHRGWIDEAASKDISARAYTSPAPVRFAGIVRKPDYNRFSSGNNPAGDQWLRLDPAQIARERKLGPTTSLVMYAEESDPAFTITTLNETGWAPRNKHLQYALFWYGMAAVLAGFYVFTQWRNKKAA